MFKVSHLHGFNQHKNDPFFDRVAFLCSMAGADEATSWIDEGFLHATITRNGNTKVDDAVTLLGQNTTLFDGTGDFLTTPDSNEISVVNDIDITMEAWIYRAVSGSSRTIFGKRAISGATEFTFSVDASNKLRFLAFATGSSVVNLTSTASIVQDTWTHVAAVRTGGANWVQYIDGVADGSGSESSQPTGNTALFHIGRDPFNTANDWNGRISEARYTLYARYLANFTRPAAPFPRW